VTEAGGCRCTVLGADDGCRGLLNGPRVVSLEAVDGVTDGRRCARNEEVREVAPLERL
jgi:hypothetical protein